jgi:hypothetical protein
VKHSALKAVPQSSLFLPSANKVSTTHPKEKFKRHKCFCVLPFPTHTA